MVDEEKIAIVDEKDRIIGEATLDEAHGKGLLHREALVYLIAGKKVLLQKRQDNHLWDHSAAGHMAKNEGYLEAAKRETEEELGIKIEEKELKKICKERIEITSHKKFNRRFVTVFLLRKEIPIEDFHIDPKEVEAVQYFSREEIDKILDMTGKSTQYFLTKYIFHEIS